jgi:hypothetical protein
MNHKDTESTEWSMWKHVRGFLKELFPSEPAAAYEMHFADGRILRSPQEAQIEEALRGLVADPMHWVTLSQAVAHFVVFSGSVNDGFIVEFEPGTRDNHQMAKRVVTLEEAVAICRGYCANDQRWYETLEWERVPVGEIDLRKAPRMPPVGRFT